MAVTLTLERGEKTLDELFAEADRPEFQRRLRTALKGQSIVQYVKGLRRELEREYPGDSLFEFYTQP